MRAALRAVACSGAAWRLEASADHLVEAAVETRPSVVLFHWQHAGPTAFHLAREVAEACPAAALLVLSDPSPPPEMEPLLGSEWFSHLLGLQSPWFMEELGAVLAKLDGRPLFGLRTVLPWGTHLVELQISSSEDKDEVFGRIEAFMGAMGIRGRLVARLQDVADEMLMNAVYDAPVDWDSGVNRFADLARQERVALDPEDRPTLSFGSDGRTFGISVSDPFGGLDPRVLKRYIAKGLRRGADQIDRKVGGAGLGLYLLFKSLNSMSLHLSPGRRTEVMGLVDIRGSYRALTQAPKSLNLLVREGRG